MLSIPPKAAWILNTLEQHGFEAYVVGGCVRDSMLLKMPEDWDICTSALPHEIKECFSGNPVLETGIRHGTVTVLAGAPYEVTTFRTDGNYSDSRHPDSVQFVRTLREDLSRRDFTINAMAYSPQRGLVDLFGGQEDLIKRQIRCVGDPQKRFSEDALRILRALRFASVYGFWVEENTSDAIHSEKDRISCLAPERIKAELVKILCGEKAEEILLSYSDIFCVFLPELSFGIGFHQNHPMHCYDVWHHLVKSVVSAPQDETLRLTMLLHDIAKPLYCTTDADHTDHFYGHANKSAEMADVILRRLRFDNETRERVRSLIFYHGVELTPDRRLLKRRLNKLGKEQLFQLIEVKRADTLAQAPACRAQRLKALDETAVVLQSILSERQCFSVRDLAVNGSDLLKIGVPEGKKVGKTLQYLVEQVIEEKLPNEKKTLLDVARRKNSIDNFQKNKYNDCCE